LTPHHNLPLEERQKVVMSDTATVYKKDSTTVTFDNDISLLKRIKKHLANCDCCRKNILEEITDRYD
jgi:transcription elongation factor GreA-like protein